MDFLIYEDEIQNEDANGCTAIDYADESTLVLRDVSAEGRALLAQGIHPQRVIEAGHARPHPQIV